jgi:hypothetical protein
MVFTGTSMTDEDLKDWPRMSKLLQELLPKPSSQKLRSIKPETQHHERREIGSAEAHF